MACYLLSCMFCFQLHGSRLNACHMSAAVHMALSELQFWQSHVNSGGHVTRVRQYEILLTKHTDKPCQRSMYMSKSQSLHSFEHVSICDSVACSEVWTKANPKCGLLKVSKFRSAYHENSFVHYFASKFFELTAARYDLRQPICSLRWRICCWNHILNGKLNFPL